MRNYDPLISKLIEKKVPGLSMQLFKLFEQGKEWLEQILSGKIGRQQELPGTGKEFVRRRGSRREYLSDQAVIDGYLVIRMRALHGPKSWSSFCGELGISTRTAFNLMALAVFAKREPEIYYRLRFLGPTKLYRVARLPKEAMEHLIMSHDVEVPGQPGTIRALDQLTDRELEIYLHKVCPVERRPMGRRARSMAFGLYRIIENLPKSGERPARIDLEMIRDAARNAADKVAELLTIAA